MVNLKTTNQKYALGSTSTSNTLNGAIDEVYVFNTLLTDNQRRGLAHTNNMSEFNPSVIYKQTTGKILLGALFGVKSGTVEDAMKAGGTFGQKASASDLGVAVATGSGENLAQAFDITGNGLKFDLTNAGAGTCYNTGAQNAKVNTVGIRTNGSALNENDLVGTTKVCQNFKIEEGIGLHSSNLVTFDLNEIVKNSSLGDDSRFVFVAKAGENDSGVGNINSVILVSDANQNVIGSYVNGSFQEVVQDSTTGTWSFKNAQTTGISSRKTYDVNLLLPEGAAYLTLAVLENGTDDKSKNSDHGIFSQAHLRQVQVGTTSKEMPLVLNRLAGIGRTEITSGSLYDQMLANQTAGTQITTATLGVNKTFGSLKASDGKIQLASDASWKFNFLNTNPSGYAEGKIYNSQCGANPQTGDLTCASSLNTLLGTLASPNDFIGVHAESGITFDLDELRTAMNYPAENALQFTVTATGTHGNTSSSATPIALVSNDEGVLAGYIMGEWYDLTNDGSGNWSFSGVTSETIKSINGAQSVNFDFYMNPDAKYLTLVYSGAGASGSDHFAWLNATLRSYSYNEIPEPSTWVLLLVGMVLISRGSRFQRGSR